MPRTYRIVTLAGLTLLLCACFSHPDARRGPGEENQWVPVPDTAGLRQKHPAPPEAHPSPGLPDTLRPEIALEGRIRKR